MKVMIHKIHKGAEFNEVEEGGSYYIVGRGQSIHDYSTVHFPTDIRSCEVCHTGPDGDNYKTQPSRDACGSCHDKVDFKTGENHGPGLPQSSDKDCSSCHQATISSEFDASIPGAHVIERRAPSLSGVNFEILSVTNMAPSEYPTVTYTIIDDGGDPISLDEMDRVRFVVAGPSKDFEEYWRDNGGLDSFDNGDGTYSYTLESPIPAEATGSYGIGIEGRRLTDLDEEHTGVRDTGFNDVYYFAVTDSVAVSRRTVVSQENCDSCHEELAAHGSNRKNVQYCIFCHIPSEIGEEDGTVFTVDMKYMIHKIHRGEEAETEYFEFSELRYPGDLRNCEACHVDDSYTLPLENGVLPTLVSQDSVVLSTTPPTTSVCTSCHDSVATFAHAELQTTESGVESCAVCHGEGRESDVATVHGGIHYAVIELVNFE